MDGGLGLVIAILAGGWLFWAMCRAIRQTFHEAAQHQSDVLEEFDRDRLEAWWRRDDPRNQK